MKEKTYEHLRDLAIVDARRRLKLISIKLRSWSVEDRLDAEDKPIGKMFTFELLDRTYLGLTLNEYATLREVKYIVWRFDLLKEELEWKKK